MESLLSGVYSDIAQQNAAIISNMPCGFAIIEFTDHITARFLNDWTYTVSGYSREEIDEGLGRSETLFSDVHPEDLPAINEKLGAVLSGEDAVDLIYRVRHRDGHYFYVKLSATVKLREPGKLTVYGVLTDVDRETRLQQQLSREKAEKENLMDSVPGGIAKYTVDSDGGLKMLYCSEGMARLVGKTIEQYRSDFARDWTENIYSGDVAMVRSALETCLRTLDSVDITYRLIHADGHLVWVNVQGRVIGEENGMPLAHVVFHGVSSEDRLYQKLLNNTDTIVQVSDLETREILYANRAAADFAGRDVDDIAGRKCYEYMMHSEAPCPFCDLKGLEGGIHREVELGGECFDVRVELIDWNGHKAYVEYVDNITDAWKIRRSLQSEKDSLQTILSRIPTGVVVYRIWSDGSIYVEASNKAIQELVGGGKARIGLVSEELFFSNAHPDDVERAKESFYSLMRGETRTTTSFRMEKEDGGYLWLRFDGTGIPQSDGSVLVYAGYTDISEQKAAEQERQRGAEALKDTLLSLNESHRSLTMAAEQARLTCWQVDLKTGQLISEQRPDWLELIKKQGISSADFAKLIVSPEDHHIYREMRDAVASGAQEHVVFDLHVILPDGGRSVWRRVTYDLLRDDNGAPARLLGLAQDIDEFMQARRRFDEELGEIENAVDQDDVLVTVRANLTQNRIENYQGRESSDLGLKSGDKYTEGTRLLMQRALTEEQAAEIYRWHDRERLLKRFESGENSYSFDFQRCLSDGRVIWVNSTARLYRQPGGTDVMCFMYCYDVDELHTARDVASRVVENNFEFLTVVDARTGRITYTVAGKSGHYLPAVGDDYETDMAAAARYIAPGNAYAEFMHVCSISNVTEMLESAEEFSYPVDSSPAFGGGRRLIQFMWLDDRHTKILMTHSDVTAVYKREIERTKQLSAALETARQASRAKSDFLSRMSHDIRTPMNAIIGLTALTLDETGDQAAVTDNLTKIRSSSDFLLALVNDILDMAKIEEGVVTLHPEPYCYTDFLTNISTIIAPLCAGKGIALKFEKVTDSLTIMTDRTRLNQIFFNILSNAVKYTPEGGTITYHTANLSIENGRTSADYIVSDTGIGMSEEFQKHMFEPFAQEDNSAKPQLQGSGLGLPIVKNLVELMGGTIKVDSAVGKGTTVTVHLSFDLATDGETQNSGNSAAGDTGALSGKRVLLCEDHPLNAEIAKKLLAKKHMEVVWAENGREAVDRFEASAPGEFDAVLMDIRMPVMNGLDAARAIRASRHPDAASVPIVAMTANAYDEDMEKSRAAGMNAHLSKPIDPAMLYATLRALCADR